MKDKKFCECNLCEETGIYQKFVKENCKCSDEHCHECEDTGVVEMGQFDDLRMVDCPRCKGEESDMDDDSENFSDEDY